MTTHHKVEVARTGEQHQGPCPLPCHGDRPNVAPFSAHLGRGIFQCFGCGAKGNQLEFSALMSGALLSLAAIHSLLAQPLCFFSTDSLVLQAT